MRMLVRRFWGTIILLVLVVAVCIQLGREAFPMLDDYREQIAAHFSDLLGVDVDIGGIEARWVGLRPRVAFQDVTMHAEDGERILAVGVVDGELSLINSLREWQLVWRELEFANLDLQFEQGDDGRWTLGGLALARPRVEDSLAIKDPLDIFLLSRHVRLREARFELAFRTGHAAELTIPELMLENEAGFRRVAANFSVDGDSEAFSVVIEGHGNPRAERDFRIEGHLALGSFPMEKVIAALDLEAWDAASEGEWSEGHRLDARLWFSGNPYRDLTLQGHLRADGLPLKAPAKVQLPSELRTDITGAWRAGEGWRLALQDAQMAWDEFQAPRFTLTLAGAFGQPWRAAIDRLDLAVWHGLLQRVGLLRGKVGKVLDVLAPRGTLSKVHLLQKPASEGWFELRADLTDVAVEAWRGAPAVASLDGYLEASARGGRVVIASDAGFSMTYPKIYRDAMTYNAARGEVRWRVRRDPQQVEISSGLVRLTGEDGRGAGYLHLKLPYGPQPRRIPEMTLLVGLRDSEARFHRRYVPYKVPASLREWLQDSVQGGRIREAGFLFHGPLRRRDGRATIQFFSEVADASLQFNRGWPAAEEVDGRLMLDNGDLEVAVADARISGNRVEQALVRVSGTAGSRVLRADAHVSGDLADALQLLRGSPVAATLGDNFHQWRGEGAVAADLSLVIPLEPNPAVGVDVQARLAGGALTMPELGLTFEEISGPLHYSSDAGLQSNGLALNLWRQPAQVRLSTERTQSGTRRLQLNFAGRAAAADLAQWLKAPQLAALAEGTSDFSGSLRIPFGSDRSLSLDISSDLAGTALALPAPYGKNADGATTFEVQARLGEDKLFQIAYGDLARAQLRLNDGLDSASLAFGSSFQPLESGYLDVSGRVGQVNLRPWRELLQRLGGAVASGADASGLGRVEDWPLTPRFDLHLEQLQLEQFALQQLYLSGEHRYRRWRVDVRSPYLYGEFFVFDDGRPLQVDLASLRLPVAEASAAGGDGTSPVGLLAELDLSRLPPMDFATASLSSAGREYGAWSFNLRPIDGGIVLRNLRGDSMGLHIDGGDSDRGAELIWLQSRERNSTYVRGRVATGEFDKVLRELGQAELLESQAAHFDVELLWPGAPDALRLDTLEGSIDFAIRDGRFIRGADAGNNPFLRLFGLLNFDTIARRLQLDFSDLYKEGMVFDSVAGELHFDRGRVRVTDPIRVESPSSTLHFAGVLDARSEELDASLVATLPMSGNLAVAAAFVGGLPAAVGVYAVSKILKEQVDKMSSIRYRITGEWQDPHIRVDRIFESSTDVDSAALLGPAAGAGEGRGADPSRQTISAEPDLPAREPPEL